MPVASGIMTAGSAVEYFAYFGDRTKTLTLAGYSKAGEFVRDLATVPLTRTIRLAYGMQIITGDGTVADGTIATMSRRHGDPVDRWRVHVVDPINKIEYIHEAEADQPAGLGDWSASHILFSGGFLYWFELHCPTDELTQVIHAFKATPDLTTVTDIASQTLLKADYFDIWANVNASASIKVESAGHFFEGGPDLSAQVVVNWPAFYEIDELWIIQPGGPAVARFEGSHPVTIKESAEGWHPATGINDEGPGTDAYYYPGADDQPGSAIFQQASNFTDPVAVWQSTGPWDIDEDDTAGAGAGEHVHAITRRPSAGDLVVYVLRHVDVLGSRPHKGARILEAAFDATSGDPTVAINVGLHPSLADFPDVVTFARS